MSTTLSKCTKKLLAILATVLVFTVLLYIIINRTGHPYNPVDAPISTTPTAEKEMPEAMKQLLQNDSVEWMAGIWVEFPNCFMDTDPVSGVEIYSNAADMLHASVTVQNGLEKVQPYYLMVLADGIPVEFTVGENAYQAYTIDLTTDQLVLDLELNLEFALGLGRLDFLLFYDGNPQSDFHMVSYTTWFKLDEERKEPAALINTIEQRPGVKDSFNDGAYNAWFWNENERISQQTYTGPRDITLCSAEKLVLEVIASAPGIYRTVLIYNGQPLSFLINGNTHSWVDWESNGTNMLQVPITLLDDIMMDGSIFTVSTPIGAESLSTPTFTSWKIQVAYSGVNKE